MHRKACNSRRCASSRLLADRLRLAEGGGEAECLPQFVTTIDGLDIHFIHVRSREKNALPLIITHGWPGSVLEQIKLIGPPTDRVRREGRRRVRCSSSRPCRLRILREADEHRLGSRAYGPSLGGADEAPRLHPSGLSPEESRAYDQLVLT